MAAQQPLTTSTIVVRRPINVSCWTNRGLWLVKGCQATICHRITWLSIDHLNHSVDQCLRLTLTIAAIKYAFWLTLSLAVLISTYASMCAPQPYILRQICFQSAKEGAIKKWPNCKIYLQSRSSSLLLHPWERGRAPSCKNGLIGHKLARTLWFVQLPRKLQKVGEIAKLTITIDFSRENHKLCNNVHSLIFLPIN